MANSVCAVFLTDAPIGSPGQEYPAETGGVVDFWGVVRKTENGSEIAAIKYEAHRAMAEHQLQVLAEEAARRFELTQVRITHRLGAVPAGEASLLVRIGSRHRAAVFEASVWLVDELKKRVPIWKHPVFTSRSAESAAA
ncbi:MAG: molybdenum cofactor biosynthesis protein MoaE [Chthoniobacterales bacterium]|nr:molybdenum cofactor biosynthesis protein MoaE [Chthoniobacterales bacterium]